MYLLLSRSPCPCAIHAPSRAATPEGSRPRQGFLHECGRFDLAVGPARASSRPSEARVVSPAGGAGCRGRGRSAAPSRCRSPRPGRRGSGRRGGRARSSRRAAAAARAARSSPLNTPISETLPRERPFALGGRRGLARRGALRGGDAAFAPSPAGGPRPGRRRAAPAARAPRPGRGRRGRRGPHRRFAGAATGTTRSGACVATLATGAGGRPGGRRRAAHHLRRRGGGSRLHRSGRLGRLRDARRRRRRPLRRRRSTGAAAPAAPAASRSRRRAPSRPASATARPRRPGPGRRRPGAAAAGRRRRGRSPSPRRAPPRRCRAAASAGRRRAPAWRSARFPATRAAGRGSGDGPASTGGASRVERSGALRVETVTVGSDRPRAAAGRPGRAASAPASALRRGRRSSGAGAGAPRRPPARRRSATVAPPRRRRAGSGVRPAISQGATAATVPASSAAWRPRHGRGDRRADRAPPDRRPDSDKRNRAGNPARRQNCSCLPRSFVECCLCRRR